MLSLSFAVIAGCTPDEPAPLDLPASVYPERWRPQLHLSPAAGWLNDPNGLVWFGDTWHLFYQHFPDGITWGPMSWGHATSTDLVHWEHQPVALSPDEVLGDAFSGSAVVQDDVMQLLFTSSGGVDGTQKQARVTSLDGRAFSAPAVVLPNPGERDFRDPKVFRDHDDWVMALAVGDHVAFYRSTDLAAWEHQSDYAPVADGVIECPDLLAIDDRQVLVFSTSTGGAAGGSGAWYVVGAFDGVAFTADTEPRPLDYGADAYAFQSWANTDRTLGLSWMANWRYALTVPTGGDWRGAMTLPRELSLDGDDLVQTPAPQLDVLEAGEADASALLRVRARLGDGDGLVFSNGEALQLTYADGVLALDRSAMAAFAGDLPSVHEAAVEATTIDVDVWLDTASIEVFADGGRVVFTDLVFPTGDAWSVTPTGAATVEATSALRTIWPVP